MPLADHLIAGLGGKLGKPGLVLDERARKALRAHPWPGNVRELANVLERAAILTEGKMIVPEHLLLHPTSQAGPVLDGTLKDLERLAISRALEATGGHRKKTAERLGIGLRTLYDKLKEYHLDKDEKDCT